MPLRKSRIGRGAVIGTILATVSSDIPRKVSTAAWINFQCWVGQLDEEEFSQLHYLSNSRVWWHSEEMRQELEKLDTSSVPNDIIPILNMIEVRLPAWQKRFPDEDRYRTWSAKKK